jgi:NTP pyrophosphatase (non-canonical NTP hydrolase)
MDQPPTSLSPLTLSDIDACLADIKEEIIRAKTKHPNTFHGPHEGYAVALEEVDELWDEIKKDGGGRDLAARKEAMQAAAMFVRYMAEVCHQPLRKSRPLPPLQQDTAELDD